MDTLGRSITILITGLRRGGAETQAVRIARALDGRGWTVRLLTLVADHDYRRELDGTSIHVESFAMGSALAWPVVLYRLRSELRRNPPHVLLSFMYHANITARIAAWGCRIPTVVCSIRNENFGGRWRDWMTRTTDSLCHVTTTNSNRVAEQLVQRKVVPEGRLVVVPNAVEQTAPQLSDLGREEQRRVLGASCGDFVWLTAGRLTQAKNQLGLIEAFHTVLQRGQKAHLWIAGSGELSDTLERRISDLGLADHVRLLGLRRNLPALMEAADGFVLSSLWEGVPNVVLEALAVGLPIVATRVGGVAEVLGENYAWLPDPGDLPGLERAMVGMMGLGDLEREVLVETGYTLIRDRYAEETVVKLWLDLFERVAGGDDL